MAQNEASDQSCPDNVAHTVPIWRDVFMTLSAHAGPILMCAGVCVIMTQLLDLALGMPEVESLVRKPAISCAFQESTGRWPWLRSGIAFGVHTLMHSLITYFALQGSRPVHLRSAVHTILACLPKLVVSGGIYGVLMALVVVGLAPFLVAVHLNPPQLWNDLAHAQPLDTVGHEVMAQTVNAALVNPGELFCNLAQSLQTQGLFRVNLYTMNSSQTADQWVNPIHATFVSQLPLQWSMTMLQFWFVTLSSLLLMIGTGILFRFRILIVLERSTYLGRNRSAQFADLGLLGSARLIWKHFGRVGVGLGLMRVVVVCIQVLFVISPSVLAQRIAIQPLGQFLGAPWIYPISVWLISVSTVGMNGFFIAFALVYDARLFAALRQMTPRVNDAG